jgi:hypothetical protein
VIFIQLLNCSLFWTSSELSERDLSEARRKPQPANSTFCASCVTDIHREWALTVRLLQLITRFPDCWNWWPGSRTAETDDPVPRLLQMQTQFPDCCNDDPVPRLLQWWPGSQTAATDDPVPGLLQLMTRFPDCCKWWPGSQTAAMMTRFPDCCNWWPSSQTAANDDTVPTNCDIFQFNKTFSLSPESFRPSFCCPTWSGAIGLTDS